MGKKSAGRVPKTKCCVSSDKCGRCPLRMLKEGTLPPEFAVRKRRLVHAGTTDPVRKGELGKKAKKPKKGKKARKKELKKSGGPLPVAA